MRKTICSGCGLYSLVYIDGKLSKHCLFAQEGESGLAIVLLPEESEAEGRKIYEVITAHIKIEHVMPTPNEEV